MEFVEQYCDGTTLHHLAGSSVHVDLTFLRVHMPAFAALLPYRVVVCTLTVIALLLHLPCLRRCAHFRIIDAALICSGSLYLSIRAPPHSDNVVCGHPPSGHHSCHLEWCEWWHGMMTVPSSCCPTRHTLDRISSKFTELLFCLKYAGCEHCRRAL